MGTPVHSESKALAVAMDFQEGGARPSTQVSQTSDSKGAQPGCTWARSAVASLSEEGFCPPGINTTSWRALNIDHPGLPPFLNVCGTCIEVMAKASVAH